MICLESDDESENPGLGNWNDNETRGSSLDLAGNSRWTFDSIGSGSSPGKCLLTSYTCSSPLEMLCLFVYVIANYRETYFMWKCYSR